MERRLYQNTRRTGLNVFENLHRLNSAISSLANMETILNDLITTPPSLGWDPNIQKSFDKLGAEVTSCLETLQKIQRNT